jgi:hypothetical protein
MPRFSQPIELRRRTLNIVFGCAALAIIVRYVMSPLLPLPWRTAGSPELYIVGVIGGFLLLVPMAFSLSKRREQTAAPRLWFIAHILSGTLGLVLVVIHSTASWSRPPALLVLLIFFLVVQGYWARTRGGDRLATIMASRPKAFLSPTPSVLNSLQSILAAKQDLLKTLENTAAEGTFSPRLTHWLRHPFLTFAYARLSHTEADLIEARRSADPVLARWRKIHIIAAWLLVIGLFIHVATVTLFAGYVADGGEITWWHLAEWGR